VLSEISVPVVAPAPPVEMAVLPGLIGSMVHRSKPGCSDSKV
jgi:hypothetical protein